MYPNNKRMFCGLGLWSWSLFDSLHAVFGRLFFLCIGTLFSYIKPEHDMMHPNQSMMLVCMLDQKSRITTDFFFFSDDCFISLTMNTAQFCGACIVTSQSMLLMHTLDREALITDSLVQIFKAEINHIEDSLESDRFVNEVCRFSFI